MAKQIVTGENSRQAILRGVNQLADAVKITRGTIARAASRLAGRYRPMDKVRARGLG